jgi:hypothetical protein
VWSKGIQHDAERQSLPRWRADPADFTKEVVLLTNDTANAAMGASTSCCTL